jgi:hypothetical protein
LEVEEHHRNIAIRVSQQRKPSSGVARCCVLRVRPSDGIIVDVAMPIFHPYWLVRQELDVAWLDLVLSSIRVLLIEGKVGFTSAGVSARIQRKMPSKQDSAPESTHPQAKAMKPLADPSKGLTITRPDCAQ